MRQSRLALLALVFCVACTPTAPEPVPAPYNVTETILDPASGPAAPLITVRASAAPELTRDDWALAEGAARDHCTGQGARFELLPATRAYTQVQYDDGLWSFVARCAG